MATNLNGNSLLQPDSCCQQADSILKVYLDFDFVADLMISTSKKFTNHSNRLNQ